jgi:hypothetical protein
MDYMINDMDELDPFEDQHVLVADGFEEAFLGFGMQFNTRLAVYNKRKCINILIERDGLTEQQAHEAFEFNVANSYVGPHTPIFLELNND